MIIAKIKLRPVARDEAPLDALRRTPARELDDGCGLRTRGVLVRPARLAVVERGARGKPRR